MSQPFMNRQQRRAAERQEHKAAAKASQLRQRAEALLKHPRATGETARFLRKIAVTAQAMSPDQLASYGRALEFTARALDDPRIQIDGRGDFLIPRGILAGLRRGAR